MPSLGYEPEKEGPFSPREKDRMMGWDGDHCFLIPSPQPSSGGRRDDHQAEWPIDPVLAGEGGVAAALYNSRGQGTVYLGF